MIRRPPRSTLDRSSAASDVYKRQRQDNFRNPVQVLERFLAIGKELLVASGDHPPTLQQMEVYKPVSYTHLRAHETVLDIVCRLLLEKKKTKNKKNKKNKKRRRKKCQSLKQ